MGGVESTKQRHNVLSGWSSETRNDKCPYGRGNTLYQVRVFQSKVPNGIIALQNFSVSLCTLIEHSCVINTAIEIRQNKTWDEQRVHKHVSSKLIMVIRCVEIQVLRQKVNVSYLKM
jgi:hypothetical protein